VVKYNNPVPSSSGYCESNNPFACAILRWCGVICFHSDSNQNEKKSHQIGSPPPSYIGLTPYAINRSPTEVSGKASPRFLGNNYSTIP